MVIFTQKNTCAIAGYLYNGNHIKVIHINYMRVINMTINEIRVIAKLFYGEADAYDKSAPYDKVVQTMRDISEFRFQIAREKCHLNGYTKDYDSFTKFMES